MSNVMLEGLADDARNAADLESFRLSVLCRLERVIGADSAAVIPVPSPLGHGDDRGVSSSGVDQGLFAAFLRNRKRYYVSLQRAFRAMASGGGLVVDDDVYSRCERDRLDVYVETIIPAGINSILASVISFRGRATALVCLNRHARGARFRSRDVERMRCILPILGMADAAADAAMEGRVAAAVSDELRALSPREREVARLIESGLQNKEIAAFLGTCPETVKKQTIAIYRKLGVSGRIELVTQFGNHLIARLGYGIASGVGRKEAG
jgi:DNA-binding CsgD family transcriptional regulator